MISAGMNAQTDPEGMSDPPDFSVERQIRKRLEQFTQGYWFQGQTAEQFWRWQVERRQHLRRAMRLELPTVYAPPRAEVIESNECEGIRRSLIALETEPDFWLPVYLLKPTGEYNGRTLIALHGDGRGAVDVIGMADEHHTQQHIEQHQYDYADRWARAGFFVAAPELRGYGRLMLEDDRRHLDRSPADQLWRNSVDRLMAIYLRLGRTYAGCCAADLIRLLDYLESLEDVDPDRLGIGGMGQGARALSWLIALDDRVSAAAVAALKRADADTLLQPSLNPPAMVDARTLVDHASIFACYAPRPLCLQAGRRDSEIPVEHVQAMADRLADLYALCDADSHLTFDLHSGGRVFDHPRAIEFFEHWL